MKPKLLILAPLCLGLTSSQAEDKPDQFKSATGMPPWNSKFDRERYEQILQEKPAPEGIQIGKGDYVVTGPLIESFRRQKLPPNASLGRRLLRLPIVRLFVPRPMPMPPGGGPYFKWGQSDLPWTAVASGSASSSDPIRHESQANLISVSAGKK